MKKRVVRSISLLLCLATLFMLLPFSATAKIMGVKKPLTFGKTYQGKLEIVGWDYDIFSFSLTKTSRITFAATVTVKDTADMELYVSQNSYVKDYESIDVEELRTPTAWTLGQYKYKIVYLLPPGDYTFTVYKDSSERLEYSFSTSRANAQAPKPDAPSVSITGIASSGKPKISWNSVNWGEEYHIYRSTSKSGSYTKIKTITGTSYTDTSAKAGKTYYYKVKAASDSGAVSSFSNVVSRTCDLPRPDVKATNVASSGKIKLTWNKIDGAQKYQIYRSTSKDGEYTLMKTVTGTTYTNTSAKAGKTYYYKVKAIHSNSAANSAFSEVDQRMGDLARPNVTIKLKNGDPRLSWEKIAGATKYQIYRATSKSGKYTLMKTVTGTTYTNTSAKAGKTYYYKVKAIHSNSNANSAFSAIKSIKAK